MKKSLHQPKIRAILFYYNEELKYLQQVYKGHLERNDKEFKDNCWRNKRIFDLKMNIMLRIDLNTQLYNLMHKIIFSHFIPNYYNFFINLS